jgi:hypothetical protein
MIGAQVDTFQWKVSSRTTTSPLLNEFVEHVAEVTPLTKALL